MIFIHPVAFNRAFLCNILWPRPPFAGSGYPHVRMQPRSTADDLTVSLPFPSMSTSNASTTPHCMVFPKTMSTIDPLCLTISPLMAVSLNLYFISVL